MSGCRALFPVCAFTAWIIVGSAGGQSFNIDFGDGPAPDDSYAGAGQAGHWNVIPGGEGSYSLMDVNGMASSVTITNPLTFFTTPFSNPVSTGDANAPLLDDFFVLEGDVGSQFMFQGLEDGMYELIVYGIWVGSPDEPTSVVWISDDLVDFQDDIIGDEPYSGLEQGVTHSSFIVPVTNGTLNVEALGIFNLETESFGNINGVQLVLIPAPGAAVLLVGGLLTVGRRRCASRIPLVIDNGPHPPV